MNNSIDIPILCQQKQKRAQRINFTHLANKFLHCHWRVN